MVTPVLTVNGRLRNPGLESDDILAAIRAVRKDLLLQGHGKFQEWYQDRHGPAAMDDAYRAFFEGTIAALQTSPQFWKEVESDYLMVLKLISGIRLKTLDERNPRQLRLEAELWECDSMEVVWRATVDCRSDEGRAGDSEFILQAVARLFNQLPPVRSGYEKGTW